MQILAATDFSSRSNRAVRQAGLLAQAQDAQLHLLHVVDDDQPEELVGMESREAERVLTEQMSSMSELHGVQCRPIVVTGDPFDGILRTAAEVRANLVVMGSHRKQFLRDIFIGTTIERVIRNGSIPVLMVNNEAQRHYEKVVVALDMSETSVDSLRVAQSTGLIVDGRATLLHAFWPIAEGKMYSVASDQASMDEYLASERRRVMDELATFLIGNGLNGGGWSMSVEAGGAMEVISRAITEMRPDLLVMGTRGRSALLRTLIGSVTEEALRSLNVDILAVPTPR